MRGFIGRIAALAARNSFTPTTRTPNRRFAKAAKPKAGNETTRPRTASATNRPAGIFLSRPAKAEGNPEVPASLWALAGAPLGNEGERTPHQDTQEEAESDNDDVKEGLDDSGTARITR